MIKKFVSPNNLQSLFFTVAGDGLGGIDFIGDYSSTSVIPKIVAPSNKIYEILEIVFILEHANVFTLDSYVPGDAGTVDRVNPRILRDTSIIKTFDPVRNIQDYAYLAEGNLTENKQGSNTNYAVGAIKFKQIFGDGIFLDGNQNDSFELLLNTDFTGMVQQNWLAVIKIQNI